MTVSPRRVLIVDYNVTATMLSGHSLLALLDNLDPSRYQAMVVFNRLADVQRAVEKRGIPTAIIPHGGGNPARRVWQYAQVPLQLGRIAKKFRPALVHANNAMAGRTAMALKLFTQLPVIVHLRNIGECHPRIAPFVLRADHFAAVSAATVSGTLPPEAQQRSTVVWDGIDVEAYRPAEADAKRIARRNLGLPTDRLVIGMAGRITPQKGQHVFVEAAKQVLARSPNVVFAHAGGIPTTSAVDLYERGLAVSTTDLVKGGHFFWLAYIEEMAEFWTACDVVILPSTGPEALGRVMLEAMATGLPVVVTDCGGPKEVVGQSDTGYLVPMNDVRTLETAVHELIIYPELRLRLGANGRDVVAKSFSNSAYAARITALYDRVLAEYPYAKPEGAGGCPGPSHAALP
jgi:glycosyltransferase involved in cell wall biosynthesis